MMPAAGVNKEISPETESSVGQVQFTLKETSLNDITKWAQSTFKLTSQLLTPNGNKLTIDLIDVRYLEPLKIIVTATSPTVLDCEIKCVDVELASDLIQDLT